MPAFPKDCISATHYTLLLQDKGDEFASLFTPATINSGIGLYSHWCYMSPLEIAVQANSKDCVEKLLASPGIDKNKITDALNIALRLYKSESRYQNMIPLLLHAHPLLPYQSIANSVLDLGSINTLMHLYKNSSMETLPIPVSKIIELINLFVIKNNHRSACKIIWFLEEIKKENKLSDAQNNQLYEILAAFKKYLPDAEIALLSDYFDQDLTDKEFLDGLNQSSSQSIRIAAAECKIHGALIDERAVVKDNQTTFDSGANHYNLAFKNYLPAIAKLMKYYINDRWQIQKGSIRRNIYLCTKLLLLCTNSDIALKRFEGFDNKAMQESMQMAIAYLERQKIPGSRYQALANASIDMFQTHSVTQQTFIDPDAYLLKTNFSKDFEYGLSELLGSSYSDARFTPQVIAQSIQTKKSLDVKIVTFYPNSEKILKLVQQARLGLQREMELHSSPSSAPASSASGSTEHSALTRERLVQNSNKMTFQQGSIHLAAYNNYLPAVATLMKQYGDRTWFSGSMRRIMYLCTKVLLLTAHPQTALQCYPDLTEETLNGFKTYAKHYLEKNIKHAAYAKWCLELVTEHEVKNVAVLDPDTLLTQRAMINGFLEDVEVGIHATHTSYEAPTTLKSSVFTILEHNQKAATRLLVDNEIIVIDSIVLREHPAPQALRTSASSSTAHILPAMKTVTSCNSASDAMSVKVSEKTIPAERSAAPASSLVAPIGLFASTAERGVELQAIPVVQTTSPKKVLVTLQ